MNTVWSLISASASTVLGTHSCPLVYVLPVAALVRWQQRPCGLQSQQYVVWALTGQVCSVGLLLCRKMSSVGIRADKMQRPGCGWVYGELEAAEMLSRRFLRLLALEAGGCCLGHRLCAQSSAGRSPVMSDPCFLCWVCLSAGAGIPPAFPTLRLPDSLISLPTGCSQNWLMSLYFRTGVPFYGIKHSERINQGAAGTSLPPATSCLP